MDPLIILGIGMLIVIGGILGLSFTPSWPWYSEPYRCLY